MLKRQRVLLVSFALVLCTAVTSLAQQAPAAGPRLFVIVSIDQMRADYLTRYGRAWTGGLRRLVDESAWFSLASYPYMNTITCAGHATIGTGTIPAVHGMVLNEWYDRASGKTTSCTLDPDTKLVHFNGMPPRAAGHSARRLLVPTFADELRAQSGVKPRIASMSLKARSAIGMAGHGGDLLLWFDDAEGWSTSTAYATEPLPWLKTFLAANPVASAYGSSWTRLRPESTYLFDDDGLGEGQPNGWTRTFPHVLGSKSGRPDTEFNTAWTDTPLADAYLTRIAIEALDKMQLGQSPERRDVLAVSYSTLDHVGHAYGPRSHEVQDVLARLDLALADLIAALDRKVGRDHYVLALTGDHGVSPIPEQMAAEGVEAIRVSIRDTRARVERALEPFFGKGPHTASMAYTDLYFAPGIYDKIVSNPAAMRAVTEAILETPGIEKVYRGDLIGAGIVPQDGIAASVAGSYHRERSGDLLIVPRAYSITSGAVATHGTLYDYDSRVPLLFFGSRVKPGEYAVASTPADLAPTLAHLAGITLPKPHGRPLAEAFQPVAAPRAKAPIAKPRKSAGTTEP
jgi:predicted AlkP superfamily pyrophosphatase or phosphodiesterase